MITYSFMSTTCMQPLLTLNAPRGKKNHLSLEMEEHFLNPHVSLSQISHDRI